MDKTITLQAEGNFEFRFLVEKAQESFENEKFIIRGIASTTNIDHDNERMSEEALQTMARIINTKTVPLRMEHKKGDDAIVGSVYKATIDDRNQLTIEAELDQNKPAAQLIYGTMKNGAKIGFSVGGAVKKAVKEFSEKTGRIVKTFYDVILNEVSLTNRPSNYDSWCFAKSIIKEGESADRYRNTDFYKEFLFENRKLDYMYSFAKSIPDKAWMKKEEPIISNNQETKMEDKKDKVKSETVDKEVSEETKPAEKSEETKVEETKEKAIEDTKVETKEETAEKAEETKEETKKEETVTMKSFQDFQNTVVAGFETLAGVMAKAMKMESATDEKVEPTEKAEETKEETKKEETKDETKKEEVDYKTKAGAQEEQDAGMKETTGEEGYAVKIKSALKKMQEITGETKEKAEDTKEETTEKSIKMSSIDELVLSISGAVEKLEKSFKEKGMSVPGLRSNIVDMIKSDSDMQEAITGLMKEPGFKKSVSFGRPYMATKDGKMFALTAEAVKGEVVEKSQDGKPVKFTDAYKTGYAASGK